MADAPALTYLNLRANKLERLEELRKLTALPALRELIVSGNPLAEKLGEGWFLDTLSALRQLTRLNKTQVDVTVLRALCDHERRKKLAEREALLLQQQQENTE